MDKEELIESLKKEVCRKFGRTVESAADFDALSAAICRATSDNISSSTLKRFFGYVRYDAVPRTSTLSILARYAGYAGWSDFCGRYAVGNREAPQENGFATKASRRPGYRAITIVAVCAVLAAVCSVLGHRVGEKRMQDNFSAGNTPVADTAACAVAPDEEKYRKIRDSVIMSVRHKADSVIALRGTMPLYRYVEKCDSAYFDIVFFSDETGYSQPDFRSVFRQ